MKALPDIRHFVQPNSVIDYHNLWKLRLLTRALWIVLAGASIMIALWITRVGSLDSGSTLGIAMVAATLIALHPRFRWQVKACVLISNLTIVGMYFPLLVGVRYTSLGIAGAGAVVAAAFFGRRWSFLLIFLDFGGILAYGYAAQAGWIHPPDTILPGENVSAIWLKAGLVFLSVGSLLTIMVGGLVDSLEISVDRLKRVSQLSNNNELKYRQLIDYAPEAIVVLDLEKGKFIDVNSQAERLLGYSASELKNMHPVDVSPKLQEDGQLSEAVARKYLLLAAQGEIPVFEWLHTNKDGQLIPCEIRLLRLPSEDSIQIRGSITDIRERKKAQAIIQGLALYDNLTGLPNRKLFQDRLQHAIAASERDRQYGAIFFIDVDNFKNINDASGHASGDFFLTVVAERVSECLKETDTVARWGGDEFVVIAENLSGSLTEAGKRAEQIGEKILCAINEPISNPYARGQNFQNTVSIGITLMYGHIHSGDELLKRADIAMYQAKLSGKNRLRYFDIEMQKSVEARLSMEADLKVALRNGEFIMLFQPQYNSQRLVFGAEILLRWHHPERGMVYPGDFIPIAEETGDIIEIGNWIIAESCKKLHAWQQKAETRHLVLAVNVSPRQYREAGFVDFVKKTLLGSEIDPTRLKFELTESLMLDDIEDTIEKMEDLRSLGVSFSLDDFGTGYSSLSYLKRLPLSQLKIDQSFVRDITTDANDAVLIRTIIGMAANLNLQVLAEGVETQEQLRALLDMDCHAYQGFYFSRPIVVTEFEKLLG